MRLHLWLPIGLGLAIVILAALARKRSGPQRRHLRNGAMLYVLYVLALGVSWLASVASWTMALPFLDAFTLFFPVLIVINLSALILFDGLLELLRIRYPEIVHDLGVGAAYIVALGWLLHRGGVNVSSLLATSAVVTAVLGLSLQATLVNIIGGLALQFDDSIKEGDWVELSGTQGQVKKIRWRYTVVETRDWDTLLVPNGTLLSQTIKVLGRREGAPVQHRMWVYFNVDFRYPPGDVVRVVNEALQSAPIPRVAAEPKPHCVCYDLARETRDSFAYYAVRYWLTDLAVDDPTSSAVRERIHSGLRRAQIPLAVPAATRFLSQDDPEHARRRHEREAASRLAAIDSVDLFSRLSPEEKTRLADSARVVPFSGGEVMTRQGATANWLYILTRGEAEVRVAHTDGTESKVAELRAPTFFGEMALMTGAPREATVIASTEVDCLRIDKEDFKAIMTTRPEIAQDVSTILAQRRVELRAVRDHLDAAARNSQLVSERRRLLASVRAFFGLEGAS
jgi:small-conductance mechanosensitive channel/CRP-like cAMP-binding protein